MAPKRVRVYLLARSDRPGGNLRLQWLDPVTGRRKGRSAGTADEAPAERARADLEYELSAGLVREPAKITWERFTAMYDDEHLSGRRPATRKKAASVFNSFDALAGPKSLAVVGERLLSAYAARLRALGRKPATVAGHLAYLHAALVWAAGQGLVPAVPRVPAVKVPKTRQVRVLSLEEFERVLARCPDDVWRAYLWTLWHTGLRRTEALTLRWEESDAAPWVDLARKRITIPAASCKGDADSWLPVHAELVPVLAPLRRAAGRVFAGLPGSPDQVGKRYRKFTKAAGVRTTLHDLRRTFGTRYARTVPAQVLRRLMRHADLKTTLQFYVDLDDTLDEAVNRLSSRPAEIHSPVRSPAGR